MTIAIPFSYFVLIFSLLLAFLSSLTAFRQNPLHLKIFSMLLGIDLITELLASFGMPLLRERFNLKNNLAIYNSFVLIEFLAYAIYFYFLIRTKWFKVVIRFFLIMFPCLWLISVIYFFKIYEWNSYIHVAGSTFTIIACIVYFYQLYTQEELVSLSKNTDFWIATALLIFYLCNLPYTGMLNFLVVNYLSVAVNLAFVLRLFNIIMYSIISYAFLCRRIKITNFLST